MTQEEVLIRAMTVEDIPAVHEVEVQSFSIPWSKRAFAESLGYGHAVFLVAEILGQIVGYCGMYQVFEQGDIINIAVAEKYRNAGVGAKMIESLIVAAKQREICDLTLEVRESNERAIHLYEKYGFEKIGTRKNFYEKPRENALIMWRKGEK